MPRPIQPGDYVYIQLDEFKRDYQISLIDETGIYIFPPSNPSQVSKLIFVPQSGQWRVWGSSKPFIISFIGRESYLPSPELTKQINESMTIEEIAEQYPPPGWVEVFRSARTELSRISRILQQLGPFFPYKKDVFRAFDLTPLNNVKVVIIGQDPYHSVCNGQPVANGLAFSTNRGCPIPPSLANIYRELQREYLGFQPPSHGDLSNWARQGVLLLNTCLTVKPHQPKSHDNIWIGFMRHVFTAITAVNPKCIYLLWGKAAQDLSPLLGPQSIELMASHPSPLSARRGSPGIPAFIGCGHFRQANEYLSMQRKEPINWIHLD